MTKKLVVAILVGLFVFTGCSKEAEKPVDPYAQYLVEVREYSNRPPAELKTMADETCLSRSNGLTPQDLFDTFVLSRKIPAGEAGGIVGSAVKNMCPENLPKIEPSRV